MKRLLCALLLLACAGSARAHFVWLLPGPRADKLSAQIVFSDALSPDDAKFLKKIAHTKVYARAGEGKVVELKATMGKDALEVAVPGAGPQVVLAVCPYGVIARGKGEPFLLNYYAKSLVGHTRKAPVPAKLFTQPWDQAPLEVVVLPDKASARVLWRGKPLAGAEVSFLVPGKEDSVGDKTDKDGLAKLPPHAAAGTYGIRAGHTEAKAGELAGKKYGAVRHYATLTWHAMAPSPRRGASRARPAASAEATKLLADARAARATWKDFPGLRADLEVNVDGKVTRGKVEVSPKGAVTVALEGDEKDWARRTLASIVGHRLDGSAARDTPCAFDDEVTDHPLGRAIRVLNDEFHSSYRIRDRQVIVVNRQQGPVRFSIVVLENRVNEERCFLPAHYVVNTWDVKSGELKSSVSHRQTWKRVGKFDLPVSATTVRAAAGKLETRVLTLSNHRLRK
jgi:hypothetical protein